MKIYWFHDWLTISRAEINGFQAKGKRFMPPCSCWLFIMDPQDKHRDCEEQSEGCALYFHSFQLQHIKFPPYLRIISTEFWYKNLGTPLSRPSSILDRSMKFCIWTSAWQTLYSLGHSILHINPPSTSSKKLYIALWIQNLNLWRQKL